jgi:putative transposase
VEKGIADGKRPELTGGGLIRSVGEWAAAKALRKANALQKGDERILGDGDFVEAVLSEAKEAYARKYRRKAKDIDVDTVAQEAAQIAGIEPPQVWASVKQPKVVQARSLLCYWATSELGVSQAWLSKRLKLSQPAISLAVARGRAIAIQNNYGMGNL